MDGIFHPPEVVKEFGLDEFVLLPIDAEHSPVGADQLPRFFCLFYCPPGSTAKRVHDQDLALIQRCLGNMIFNAFSARRQRIIQKLTEFLSGSHDGGNERVLEYFRSECLPCEASFQLSVRSVRNNELDVVSATGNRTELNNKSAFRLWSTLANAEGAMIIADADLPKDCDAISGLVWQQKTEIPRERTMYVFFNKVSPCPLRGMGKENPGKEKFVDHFGFEDRELLEEIGSHIRAFTETSAEKKKRDNNSRIVSHESSQPFFDILSLLSKHKSHASHFPWDETIDKIEDAARLGHAMVEMNTELTDDKLNSMSVNGPNTYQIEYELVRLKKSLRRVCEDARFRNDNIRIDVSSACRSLDLNMRVLTTIFINTVTNSIKYSKRSDQESWCNFLVRRVYSSDDSEWNRLGLPHERRGKGILFSTTDNGIGIPDRYKERVFEQEFQVDNRSAARGLGLGLWHVKRVVTALGGDIWIQSGSDFPKDTEDKTRVSVLLPMRW